MNKRFTISDIEALEAAGKIRGFDILPNKMVPPAVINLKGRKRSKYGNNKVVVDGVEFDSQKEADRYGVHKMRLVAGEIKWLELQVPYIFMVGGKTVTKYIADFRYEDAAAGELVVEDVKSEATRRLRPYRIKKKLMASCFGIEIQEV